MQPEYTCPLCRSPISIGDVNVATDLALCRACGRTSPFSMVTGSAGLGPAALDSPPRWIRMEEDPLGDTIITYRRKPPILLFLIPFTAVWSGFSMGGIYGSQIVKGQFNAGQSVFGLPFLAGTIILLGAITFLLFGRWVVRLRDGEGTVFVGVGNLGWTRQFTYGPDTQVSLRTTSISEHNVPQKGVCVRNGNVDVTFGTMLKDEAKQFIAAAILQVAR